MKILLALTLLFVLSLASFPQTRPDLKAYTVYARSDDFAYLIKDDSTKIGRAHV